MPVWEEPHKPNAATLATTTAITSEGFYKCTSQVFESATTSDQCVIDPHQTHLFSVHILTFKGIVSFHKCIHSICKPKPTQTGSALFDKNDLGNRVRSLKSVKPIQSKPFQNIRICRHRKHSVFLVVLCSRWFSAMSFFNICLTLLNSVVSFLTFLSVWYFCTFLSCQYLVQHVDYFSFLSLFQPPPVFSLAFGKISVRGPFTGHVHVCQHKLRFHIFTTH